ncbi:MAG: hypothetical protein KDE14_13805 [Rhodobacteraceae bacterium]|nr:hypothetical protein [Paracoccaceae bacterium]
MNVRRPRWLGVLRAAVVAIALIAHGSLLVHQWDHFVHDNSGADDCALCHFASSTLPVPDSSAPPPPRLVALAAFDLPSAQVHGPVKGLIGFQSRAPPRAISI